LISWKFLLEKRGGCTLGGLYGSLVAIGVAVPLGPALYNFWVFCSSTTAELEGAVPMSLLMTTDLPPPPSSVLAVAITGRWAAA